MKKFCIFCYIIIHLRTTFCPLKRCNKVKYGYMHKFLGFFCLYCKSRLCNADGLTLNYNQSTSFTIISLASTDLVIMPVSSIHLMLFVHVSSLCDKNGAPSFSARERIVATLFVSTSLLSGKFSVF